MLNQFLKAIQSFHLPQKTRIIVATSAGLDSVALLHLLARTNHLSQFTLEIAHLTHNIRSSEEGEMDKALIQQLADSYQLPVHFYTLQRDTLNKYGHEQMARTERQRWLFSLCQTDEDKIALAHHADDQVETIFMRLQKNYPLKGLKGISAESHPIIRPLLAMKKSQLRQFLEANHLTWHEDSTNQDPSIERNYLRAQLQHITPYWPTMMQNLIHLGVITTEYNQLLDYLFTEELSHIRYDASIPHFIYPYNRFTHLPNLVRNELIFYWFNQLMKGIIRADYRLPLKFIQNINLFPQRTTLLRGHGIIIRRKKSNLYISKE
ncbi:tRNA lysidine(34) synthetase TilS [Entomospira culicis]|uniref:tRNA(Ile)-lysidine synthase n=1 Tax=Entomospira culicis TaxID=2719989 RepID=A0A968GFI6_9SPIO|nr:tRNA lysidine(34) synthetase TilS [Entomospira culicis]NIZ18858.1 tRNA lysidine(34) synthetase TilS [Entomospira culicis]NIZ69073.1 tRNA lysidine(34) synthetase TilS [Entomospira culicis]WDI37660.1 tRNA lysidine(34) synthetase TilS [Entomospira culicis]WDI39288.1 tRNA lysidine(34) synthetase TilS [Entomospira culicis]